VLLKVKKNVNENQGCQNKKTLLRKPLPIRLSEEFKI
jgi:hypothetical protein